MAKVRDGLNSSIEPGSVGASGSEGLPPRTHAIHKALFYNPGGLTLEEVQDQLTKWGYKQATVAVTREHLNSLCEGWGANKIIAAQNDEGRYSLTEEGRSALAAGEFSDRLK